MSRHGRGRAPRAEIDAPSFSARYYDPRGAMDLWFPVTAPYLKLAAVHAIDGSLALFMLNRHLEDSLQVTINLPGFGNLRVAEALELRHDDLEATNTKDRPDQVGPSGLRGVAIEEERLTARLAAASWNLIWLER